MPRGSVSKARPGADERRPPVAGRVGRPGERMDHEDLRRVRAGAVVAIGEGDGQARAAGLELERPEVGGMIRPVPRGGRADRGRAGVGAMAGASAVTSSRGADGSVAARSAWSRSARRSSMCSRPTDRRTRSGGDAGRRLLFGRELLVGRAGGMDDQALRVADVGQQAEQLDAVDQPPAGLEPPLTPNVTMPPKPPLR